MARHDVEYDPNGNRSKDIAKVMNADNSAAYVNTTSVFDYDPQDRVKKVTKTGDAAGTEDYGRARIGGAQGRFPGRASQR
ncbi:hypothetical protein ACWD5V_42740 [Streptomyces sp. NPDC002523]